MEDQPPLRTSPRDAPQQEESPLVQRVRRMNQEITPRRNAARNVLDPSPSPISKSVAKRGPAAHGISRAMTSHRSMLAPNNVTWASEVAWMAGAIGGDVQQRNVKELCEKDTILAGAKIMYFVYNDLKPENLKTLTSTLTPLEEDSLLWRKLVTDFGAKKSKWQNGVISYIEATVIKLMDAWSRDSANADHDFSELSEADRLAIWRREYGTNPRAIAQEWWKPVGGSLDWSTIFDMPVNARAEDMAKVDRVQRMLRVKWTVACENVCQFAVVGHQTPLPGFPSDDNPVEQMSAKQHLKNWRGFALQANLRDVIVDFSDIPVLSGYANSRLSVASAKGINPNQDDYVNLCWD